ncbi:MAG: septal ring lytic transglycosylase RlpA family protein [Brevinemataceae bacterium]
MKIFTKIPGRVYLFLLLVLFGRTAVFSQMALSTPQNQTPQTLYGIASWYGDEFNGKVTASGQVYSNSGLTAAHRSLPFGTRVEVENLSNGKKVQLLINDRGPFIQNRVLDVSKQAADILGFLNYGSTFVKVTILELGSSLPNPMGGVPKPFVGNDIPANFQTPVQQTPVQQTNLPVTNIPATTNTQEVYNDQNIDLLPEETQTYTEDQYYDETADLNNTESAVVTENFDDLFFGEDDELAFMDDGDTPLFSKPEEVKTQTIQSKIEPRGFVSNTNDFLITDPLSNLVLSEEDEFVATPPSLSQEILDTAPSQDTDPFADLFSDPVDDYQMQQVNKPISQVLNTNALPAQHIGENNIDSQGSFGNDDRMKSVIPPVQEPTYTMPSLPNNDSSAGSRIGEHFIVQLGAFSKQKNALDLYEKLRKHGFNVFTTDVKIKGKNLIRVRVGHFTNFDEAVQVSRRLDSEFGVENRIIKVEFE